MMLRVHPRTLRPTNAPVDFADLYGDMIPSASTSSEAQEVSAGAAALIIFLVVLGVAALAYAFIVVKNSKKNPGKEGASCTPCGGSKQSKSKQSKCVWHALQVVVQALARAQYRTDLN